MDCTPVYALIALLKKRWHSSASLYEILQILSVTLFEKIPLNRLLSANESHDEREHPCKQLILFGD